MAITVQNQQGSVAAANAYADAAAFKAFHQDRAVSVSAYSDSAIEAALIRATDFMDARYQFIGARLNPGQGTACPRYLPDGERSYPRDVQTLEPGYLLTTEQWNAVVKACIQLGYRALVKSGGLLPDPTIDGTGQRLTRKTVKAGPVETTKEFAVSNRADANVPSYPEVDLLLRNTGVLASRAFGTISRA